MSVVVVVANVFVVLIVMGNLGWVGGDGAEVVVEAAEVGGIILANIVLFPTGNGKSLIPGNGDTKSQLN